VDHGGGRREAGNGASYFVGDDFAPISPRKVLILIVQ